MIDPAGLNQQFMALGYGLKESVLPMLDLPSTDYLSVIPTTGSGGATAVCGQ